MAERHRFPTQEQLRWFRNVNILGGVALAGVGIALPQFETILFAGAALNGIQAGGAEALRMRKDSHKAT